MVKETAYIIDGDAEFVERLKKLLSQEYIITVFGSPEAAAHDILKKKPDIVITEILFSSTDGINFVAGLKEKSVESPIFIATKLHPSERIADIFSISGCVNKGLSDEELHSKIKDASGWKRKKVSPPPLPIITEGKVGESVSGVLSEVYDEKKKECLERIGAGDYSRALEIAAFLRRVYPTDLRTHGLLREIILEKKALNPLEPQTSYKPKKEEVDASLKDYRASQERKDINMMLASAKQLLQAESISNGIRFLREIVVFSEENPFLAEQVVVQKEKVKVPVWDVICTISVLVSFLVQPYIFAGIAIVSGILAITLKKEKKVASVAIPAAVVIIVLNLLHFPLMSGMVEKWHAKIVAKRILSANPQYFKPGKEVLNIRYRVSEAGPVVITASSGRQSKIIISNREHSAGAFNIEWDGKTADGSYMKNNFHLTLQVGKKSFTESIFIGG